MNMKQNVGMLGMMAALLGAPLGLDPFARPYQGGRRRGAKVRTKSRTLVKDRKAARRLSNHNRKINQAYAKR